MYACGEGTNGRLGLGHNNNISQPRPIAFLSQYMIKKVAVHSGGKHAMALTLDGKVILVLLFSMFCHKIGKYLLHWENTVFVTIGFFVG